MPRLAARLRSLCCPSVGAGHANLPRRAPYLSGAPGYLCVPGDRLRDLDEKAARLQMLSSRAGRPSSRPARTAPASPVRLRTNPAPSLADVFFEQRPQRVPIESARTSRSPKISISAHFGIAHHFDEVAATDAPRCSKHKCSHPCTATSRPAATASARAASRSFSCTASTRKSFRAATRSLPASTPRCAGLRRRAAARTAPPSSRPRYALRPGSLTAAEGACSGGNPRCSGPPPLSTHTPPAAPDRQILGAPVAIRTRQAEWRDRGHDQFRIDCVAADRK